MATLGLRARPRPAGTLGSGQNTRRPAAWALVTLLIVVLVAGWLRFASLGRLSFWADEFPHAIAARGLIHEGRPVLPSGREYRRALAQTVAVAASMRAFGENEAAARVPSAIVGLATIPLIWLAVRRRFGDSVALAAAGAIAFMPSHVAHSRSARFYAAFLLAYGAAAVLGSRAIVTGSRRTAVAAALAFAVAMHLQVAAVMLLAPLAAFAFVAWRRAPEEERRSRLRALAVLGCVAVAGAALVLAVPGMREGARRLVEHPVPGLELDPGFHLRTLTNLFGVISWWAWIPLAPAAILALRRAGLEGWNVVLQLGVPALLITILFRTSATSGLDLRYQIHLVPFVAVIAGLGVVQIGRFAVARADGTLWMARLRHAGLGAAAAAALGGASAAGVFGVGSLPSAPHPGRVIPRPNWNAAADAIRADGRPFDSLLSTGPLAVGWAVGQCGDWLRTTEAAAPFMRGGRDVYCGSRLVPDAASALAYLRAHRRGWVIADPLLWRRAVDPGARAVIEARARPVSAGDPSILLWRWGG